MREPYVVFYEKLALEPGDAPENRLFFVELAPDEVAFLRTALGQLVGEHGIDAKVYHIAAISGGINDVVKKLSRDYPEEMRTLKKRWFP